jgi:hypothetical protein
MVLADGMFAAESLTRHVPSVVATSEARFIYHPWQVNNGNLRNLIMIWIYRAPMSVSVTSSRVTQPTLFPFAP